MSSDAGPIGRVAGDDAERRWRPIGGEVWQWALWRSDDGRHALEVAVSTGHVELLGSAFVDAALVERWRRDGPAALDDDDVAALRRRILHHD